MRINDRLRPFLPTAGAFRRRSMRVKWLSCKGLCGFSTYETNRPASVWFDAQAFALHRVVSCVDLITHKLPGS